MAFASRWAGKPSFIVCLLRTKESGSRLQLLSGTNVWLDTRIDEWNEKTKALRRPLSSGPVNLLSDPLWLSPLSRRLDWALAMVREGHCGKTCISESHQSPFQGKGFHWLTTDAGATAKNETPKETKAHWVLPNGHWRNRCGLFWGQYNTESKWVNT